MSGLEQRKRRRENEFFKSSPGINCAMDLFVPLPTQQGSSGSTNSSNARHQSGTPSPTKLIEQLLSRLQDTGYIYIALTHVVHGPPRDPNDRCNIAIPDLSRFNGILKGNVVLLRRLHIVVENLSDMTMFNPQSQAQQQLLAEYDFISIAPRNESVFQAACTCDHIDIVTLDGTMSTSNTLPYTIRSTDVRSIRNRNAVLEIPYAVPILNRNARKGLVQTCRSIITASLGGGNDVPSTTSRIPLIFSSGNRLMSGSNIANVQRTDVGSVAFRTPDDLVNVMQSVLSFDTKTAICSLTESGQVALKHGVVRRQLHQQPLHKQVNTTQQHSTMTVIGIELEKRKNVVGHVTKTPKASKNKKDAKPSSLNRIREIPKPTNEGGSTENEETIFDELDDNDEEGFISL